MAKYLNEFTKPGNTSGSSPTDAIDINFQPVGNIPSGNVQDAIADLETIISSINTDFNDIVLISEVQTITGAKTFTSIPVVSADRLVINNNNSHVLFQRSGLPRWHIGEISGNGNFLIGAYNDSGVAVDNPIIIGRTSTVTIPSTRILSLNSNVASTSTTTGALVVSGGAGFSGDIYSNSLNATTGDVTTGVSGYFKGTSAIGTNVTASPLLIQPGASTGNSTPSPIVFLTSNSTTSGLTQQSFTEKMRVTGTGNLLIGTSTDDGLGKLQVNGFVTTTAGIISASYITASTILNVGRDNAPGSSLFLKASDTDKSIFFNTNGVNRWKFGTTSSDTFQVQCWNDSGTLNTILTIPRTDTSFITINRPITINNSTSASSINTGALVITGGIGSAGTSWFGGIITSGVQSQFGISSTNGQSIYLNGIANSSKRIYFTSTGVNRWEIISNSTTESGSNTGSGFQISAYDDTGNLIDSPISINRAATGNITLNRTLVSKGNRVSYSVKTSNYTLISTDEFVEGNCSSGAIIFTLPAANAGTQRYGIKKIDSSVNTLTISRTGSDTIDGQTTFVLSNQYDSITLVSNGTNSWSIY